MVMRREKVNSSAIDTIGYDEDSSTLEVQFRGGKPYNFADVSPEVHLRFIESNSKGRFFNDKIRDRYRLK